MIAPSPAMLPGIVTSTPKAPYPETHLAIVPVVVPYLLFTVKVRFGKTVALDV
jgi:hypothetical protein